MTDRKRKFSDAPWHNKQHQQTDASAAPEQDQKTDASAVTDRVPDDFDWEDFVV